MQPYHKAAEIAREREERAGNIGRNLATSAIGSALTGSAYAGVASLAPRIGAMLSNYVPEHIAIAGLKKIDPRFGKFIDGALKEGYSFGDVKNLIGEKIEKSIQQESPKENLNIIQQYSPELHDFITNEIQSGRSPLEAGALATLERKGQKGFKSVIDKITKDHKASWSSILQTVYGAGQQPQDQTQQTQQMQQNQQPPEAGGGEGQQAFMGILQQINQRFGK